MKIIIPVSNADTHLLPLLTDVLLHHGHVGSASILMVATPSALKTAEDQSVRLRTICESVQVLSTGADFEGGWPLAPNNHWHWTVTHLDNSGNREPFFWLEPDAVPMTPRWAALLEEAYFAANKSFFGFTKMVKHLHPDGSAYHKDGDDMLMGVAIYPPRISQDSEIKPLFNNLGRRGSLGLKTAFDLYLRWVFKLRGVHSTNLITDLWRTCNYRNQGGQIICDAVEGEKYAVGGVVPKEAVVVHGCKDGSLHRLILGPKEPVKMAFVDLSYQKPDEPVKVVEREVTAAAKPVDEVKMPEGAVASGAPKTLEELCAGNIRIKDLAKALGVDTPTAVVQCKGAGYKIESGGWVKKI